MIESSKNIRNPTPAKMVEIMGLLKIVFINIIKLTSVIKYKNAF